MSVVAVYTSVDVCTAFAASSRDGIESLPLSMQSLSSATLVTVKVTSASGVAPSGILSVCSPFEPSVALDTSDISYL